MDSIKHLSKIVDNIKKSKITKTGLKYDISRIQLYINDTLKSDTYGETMEIYEVVKYLNPVIKFDSSKCNYFASF